MITICPLIGRNAFIFKRLLIYVERLLWTQNHLMARNNIKNKGKHTQLLHLSTFSQESQNSKGFSWQFHVLSLCKPCEPSARWFVAVRQCQPHYGFHLSMLSTGPKKQSSKLQLTGSFPSERVSDEKHYYSKAKRFYRRFFFP